MALEKGSLVLINYTAKVKDTGEIIDTTYEDDAKKLNVYQENRKYGPRLVAIGEGWILSGLEEELQKMEPGEKKEIELSPEKAFGNRDPSLVKLIPLRKFGEKAKDIVPGDTVELDNRIGIVRFVGSGRAQVDFNHRLAGKSLTYTVEIVRRLDKEEEKVKALIERKFEQEADKISFNYSNEKLEIHINEDLFLLEGLQILKRSLANEVFKFLPSIKSVVFVETFQRKEPS